MKRIRIGIALAAALLGGTATAGDAEDLILRARHARFVRADLDTAIELYLKALRDVSLDGKRQAELHLQVAECLAESGDRTRALDPHLVQSIYADADASVRRRADALRRKLAATAAKKPKVDPGEKVDPQLRRKERAQAMLRQARRMLEDNEVARAMLRVLEARALAPDDAEVAALLTEIEQRIRGSSNFLRDPLSFLRSWTRARVGQVAQRASVRLAEGITFAGQESYRLAESRFREAVEIIDRCEYRSDSEQLDELRRRVIGHWREVRRKRYGAARAEPTIEPTQPRTDRLVTAYLNQLQEMLQIVSSGEREYRIVPVRGAQPAKTVRGWQAKPQRYALFDHLPSRWSGAQFARSLVASRVSPGSWARAENYLEASGDMLVLRHRPAVLDAAAREIAAVESPKSRTMRGVFLLVPVTRGILVELEKRFGPFQRSRRGPSPIAYRTLPATKYSLEYLASVMREFGSDLDPEADTFEVVLPNGAGRHLFCARPIVEADGYESFDANGRPATEAHYGIQIDALGLRDPGGRTALGLKLTARSPAPPLAVGGKDLLARFDSQAAELFVDLEPGRHLIVGGLRDPFAAAKGERGELLLIWAADTKGRAEPETPVAPNRGTAQVSMRRLLLESWDDPGPTIDKARGFLARPRLDVLRARAAFLQRLMQERLELDELEVNVTEAVVRVPPAKREDALALVTALEEESRERFSITIESCAVETAVLDRYLQRLQAKPEPMGDATWYRIDTETPLVLRDTVRALDPDVFTPRRAWPRLTVRGLQTRHGRSTRTMTSPALRREGGSEADGTRTVTEGLCVSVRPVRRGGSVSLFVEVLSASLARHIEEIDPETAAPAYRSEVDEFRAAGAVACSGEGPWTILVRSIPRIRTEKLDALSEVALVLTVRRLP